VETNGVEVDEFTSYVSGARDRLLRRAWRLCGNQHDAEDLLQRGLMMLYIRWDGLEHKDGLDGYLLKTMQSLHASDRRAHRWLHEVSVEDPESAAPASEQPVDVDQRLTVLAALAQLGPRQRAIVVMRYLQDCSIAETARLLGCKPKTVSGQATRAVQALRTILAPA
jgi:RNA polymerase sigma-70 factor (sigma-E family)